MVRVNVSWVGRTVGGVFGAISCRELELRLVAVFRGRSEEHLVYSLASSGVFGVSAVSASRASLSVGTSGTHPWVPWTASFLLVDLAGLRLPSFNGSGRQLDQAPPPVNLHQRREDSLFRLYHASTIASAHSRAVKVKQHIHQQSITNMRHDERDIFTTQLQYHQLPDMEVSSGSQCVPSSLAQGACVILTGSQASRTLHTTSRKNGTIILIPYPLRSTTSRTNCGT